MPIRPHLRRHLRRHRARLLAGIAAGGAAVVLSAGPAAAVGAGSTGPPAAFPPLRSGPSATVLVIGPLRTAAPLRLHPWTTESGPPPAGRTGSAATAPGVPPGPGLPPGIWHFYDATPPPGFSGAGDTVCWELSWLCG